VGQGVLNDGLIELLELLLDSLLLLIIGLVASPCHSGRRWRKSRSIRSRRIGVASVVKSVVLHDVFCDDMPSAEESCLDRQKCRATKGALPEIKRHP